MCLLADPTANVKAFYIFMGESVGAYQLVLEGSSVNVDPSFQI